MDLITAIIAVSSFLFLFEILAIILIVKKIKKVEAVKEIRLEQSVEIAINEILRLCKENAKADGFIHIHDVEVLTTRTKKKMAGK